MMENRIEELLNGIYELEFQGKMTFEEFAGVRKVGYVDNGEIYVY